MTFYKPPYYYVEKFTLDRIVYEKPLNSPNLVLYAYDCDPTFEPLLTEYLCDFNVLTDILLAGGEATEHVIKKLTDEIRNVSEEVINMQINDLTNCPITICNIILKVYRPMEQKQDGQWVECFHRDEFYLIEKASSQFGEGEKKVYRENMITAYRNYLRSIDSGFPRYQARAQAGLRHELIFRLASNIYKAI